MLFIFDWDGTLSDSAAKIVRSMQRAADDVGLAIPDEDSVKNIIGLGLPEAIRSLYPGIDSDRALSLKTRYSHQYLKDEESDPPFFPGVLDALHNLRDQGHQLSVATGKSRRGLDRVLASMGMASFFHGSRCADETASKPHPLMLRQLVEEFGVNVEDCVMVGDTEYDMDMARRVQMPRIAVSYGAHHIDRLRPFEPVLCLDHFSHILQWRR